jgi:hypothetical protein
MFSPFGMATVGCIPFIIFEYAANGAIQETRNMRKESRGDAARGKSDKNICGQTRNSY